MNKSSKYVIKLGRNVCKLNKEIIYIKKKVHASKNLSMYICVHDSKNLAIGFIRKF